MKKALLGLVFLAIASCTNNPSSEIKLTEAPLIAVCENQQYTSMLYKALVDSDNQTAMVLAETRKCIPLNHIILKINYIVDSAKDKDGDVLILVNFTGPDGKDYFGLTYPYLGQKEA